MKFLVNYKITLFVLFFSLPYCLYGQWRADGQGLGDYNNNPINSFYGGLTGIPPLSWYEYPLNINILDSGSGWNETDIRNAIYSQIEEANKRFAPIQMRFLAYNKIRKINNCGSNTINYNVINLFGQGGAYLPNYNENAINVYIVESAVLQLLFVPATDIGGFGTYPWLKGNRDVIILVKDALLAQNFYPNDPNLLAHELGHLFGLYHTFGSFPQDNINGRSDFIPDTDNDPNPGGANAICTPDHNPTNPINNIMSYNRTCHDRTFTPNQLELIRKVAEMGVVGYGRLDDFSAGCENISITLSDYINIPGDNSVKHIIKISGGLTINNMTLMNKMKIEAAGGVSITNSSLGSEDIGGNSCGTLMNNRPGGTYPDFLDPDPDKALNISHNLKGSFFSNLNFYNFLLFPNPSKNSFQIHCDFLMENLKFKISIINVVGQTLYEQDIQFENENSESISISDFTPGLYTVLIQNKDLNIKDIKRLSIIE